jgi:hypothetical protein
MPLMRTSISTGEALRRTRRSSLAWLWGLSGACLLGAALRGWSSADPRLGTLALLAPTTAVCLSAALFALATALSARRRLDPPKELPDHSSNAPRKRETRRFAMSWGAFGGAWMGAALGLSLRAQAGVGLTHGFDDSPSVLQLAALGAVVGVLCGLLTRSRRPGRGTESLAWSYLAAPGALILGAVLGLIIAQLSWAPCSQRWGFEVPAHSDEMSLSIALLGLLLGGIVRMLTLARLE